MHIQFTISYNSTFADLLQDHHEKPAQVSKVKNQQLFFIGKRQNEQVIP